MSSKLPVYGTFDDKNVRAGDGFGSSLVHSSAHGGTIDKRTSVRPSGWRRYPSMTAWASRTGSDMLLVVASVSAIVPVVPSVIVYLAVHRCVTVTV